MLERELRVAELTELARETGGWPQAASQQSQTGHFGSARSRRCSAIAANTSVSCLKQAWSSEGKIAHGELLEYGAAVGPAGQNSKSDESAARLANPLDEALFATEVCHRGQSAFKRREPESFLFST